MMPQKRNPDALGSRAVRPLACSATWSRCWPPSRGLPIGYNKTCRTTALAVQCRRCDDLVLPAARNSCRSSLSNDRMREALASSMMATDLAGLSGRAGRELS